MTPEEQAAEDERAREAALRSLATIEPAAAEARGARFVESPGFRIEAGGGMSELDAPESADAAAAAEVVPDTDALSEAGAYREPNDDPPPATSEAADYGAAGMRQMQHAIDGGGADDLGAPREIQPLRRDDAEPLGSVARSGPNEGRMFAPSGAIETPEQRFARLGVGGDFSQAPPSDASGIVRARLAPSPAPAAPPPPPAAQPQAAVTKPAGGGVTGNEPSPALDAGLPTEADISGRRATEPIGRLVHGLASGLAMVAGHGPLSSYESRADQMEQERRQGIREALQRKGVMRGQEQQQAATSARQAVQDQLAERRVAALEESTPARVEQMRAQTEATRASAEHTRMTTEELRGEVQFNAATREQREDPASPTSDGMRRAVEARLALMGPAGDDEREVLGDLGQYNANQLHDILPSLMQGVGLRVRGAGTPQAQRTSGSSLAEQYVEHNVPGAVDVAHAQALIDSLGGDDSPRAQAILVSRANEESAATPSGAAQANVAAAETSLASLQSALSRYGDDIPGIGLVEGSVPSLLLGQEGREVRAMVRDLSDNYLRMVSGAAVPEHEIDNLAARLGTYDERQFRTAIGRMQSELRARRTGTSRPRAAAARTSDEARESDSGAPITLTRGGVSRSFRPEDEARARRVGWQ